jgi:hypothetical protein
MARATRAAERHGRQRVKGTQAPANQKSNNLANIILDLRYVTGYGSG